MKSMIAEPAGYPNAVNLMKVLRDQSIECGETVGGVWILVPDDATQELVKSICSERGVCLHDGPLSTTMSFQLIGLKEKQNKN